MPQFFLVLLKINLVLILFSATYYLVLRRLTFYSLNRVFLVFGIVFSSAYPFINLTDFFSGKQPIPGFIPQLNQNLNQIIQEDSVSVFWYSLSVLFYIGFLLMAIRLLIQFVSLRQMHKKSAVGKLKDFNVRILNEEVSPFTFWQTIYINPALHQAQDLNNILEHEKVHVEEWHTLDIILAEVCVVFYWFNPGVWLMKKAVRENIEFITDAKILKKGIDKKAYQYSLLNVGSLQPSITIVNNFNLSDLKKRIKMMNAKRSSKVDLSRYLLVLPVLLWVTLAFTIDEKNVQKKMAPLTTIIKNALPKRDIQVIIEKPEKIKRKVDIRSTQELKKGVDSVEKMTFVFKTHFETTDTSYQSISSELGRLVGKVTDLRATEGAKTKTMVQHFTFKDSSRIDPNIMGVFLRDVDAPNTNKSIKATVNKVVLIKTLSKVSNDQNGTEITPKSVEETDYYINGAKATHEDFKGIDPNNILAIRVLKGNNPAIQITTKP